MIRIVNKVLESVKSIDTSLEPLNEIYFSSDKVKEIEYEVKRILNKDPTELNMANLCSILQDIFNFKKVSITIEEGSNVYASPEIYAYRPSLILTDPKHWKVDDDLDTMMSRLEGKIEDVEEINNDPTYQLYVKDVHPKYYDTYVKRLNKYKKWSRKIRERYRESVPQVKGFVISGKTYHTTPWDIKGNYLIIDQNGIKLNKDVISLTLNIHIGRDIFELYDSKIITAILLHEIGHHFVNLLLSPDPLSRNNVVGGSDNSKGDEMFADQFVAMHGYGYDLMRFLIKYKETRIYYWKRKLNLYKQRPDLDLINKMIANEHPIDENRCYIIINQMKEDLKDPYISENQKKKLLEDLKKSKALMHEVIKGTGTGIERMMQQDAMQLDRESNKYKIGGREARPKLVNLQMMCRRQKSR